MDLTARQLRTGIRSPNALAKELLHERLHPHPSDMPYSAQRPWMQGAMRRYFAQGRNPEVLLSHYDTQTGGSKRKDSAAKEISNGRKMLEHFALLDQEQVAPTRIFLPPERVELFGHGIRMGADLAYETLDGWIIRHLISDQEISQTAHLRLYATAAALHFEGRPGGGPVRRVDLWLLRHEHRFLIWDRRLLETSIPRLHVQLDEIARGASGQAA